MRFARYIALLLSSAAPAVAEDFSLSWPVECTLGDTCFIQHYVDDDPSGAASDYTCGKSTYNAHKGTDIRLRSRKDMETGVQVLAAADGVVLGLRDGMDDVALTRANEANIKDKECGNGVVIRHAGGWDTQYCHMKRGTISVAKGARVTAGTPLGEIGLSGRTQFPHLHISVRKNGAQVDPFDPDGQITCGAPSQESLWDIDIPYSAGGVLAAGFSPTVPSFDTIKAGTADQPLAPDAAAIVFWTYGFGGQRGDILRMIITGPAGEIIRHDAVLEKDQAQFFRATGKKLRARQWPSGQYDGTAVLLRKDAMIGQSAATFTLP